MGFKPGCHCHLPATNRHALRGGNSGFTLRSTFYQFSSPRVPPQVPGRRNLERHQASAITFVAPAAPQSCQDRRPTHVKYFYGDESCIHAMFHAVTVIPMQRSPHVSFQASDTDTATAATVGAKKISQSRTTWTQSNT
jgi:hypothetical protein